MLSQNLDSLVQYTRRAKLRWNRFLHWLPLPAVLLRTLPGTDSWSLKSAVREELAQALTSDDHLAVPKSWKPGHRFWDVAKENQIAAGFLAPAVVFGLGIGASLLPISWLPADSETAGTLFQTVFIGTVTLGAFVVPLLILHVQFAVNRRFSVPADAFWKFTGLEAATSGVYATLAVELIAYWTGQHLGGLWNQSLATASLLPSLAAVVGLAIVTIRTVQLSRPGVLLRRWLSDIKPRFTEPLFAAVEAVYGRRVLSRLVNSQHIIATSTMENGADEEWSGSIPSEGDSRQIQDIDVGMLDRYLDALNAVGCDATIELKLFPGHTASPATTLARVSGDVAPIRDPEADGSILTAAFRLGQHDREPVADLTESVFDALAEKAERGAQHRVKELLNSITELVTRFDNTQRRLRRVIRQLGDEEGARSLDLEEEIQALSHLLRERWHDTLRPLPDRLLHELVGFWASLWSLAVATGDTHALATCGKFTAQLEARIAEVDDADRQKRLRNRVTQLTWRPLVYARASWRAESRDDAYEYLDEQTVARGLAGSVVAQLRATIRAGDADAFRQLVEGHREHSRSFRRSPGRRTRWERAAFGEAGEPDFENRVLESYELAVAKAVSWALDNIDREEVTANVAGKIFRAGRNECSSSADHVVRLLEHARGGLPLLNDDHLDWRWELPRGVGVYTVSNENPWTTRAFVLDYLARGERELPVPELEGDVIHARPKALFDPVLDDWAENPDVAQELLYSSGIRDVPEDDLRARIEALRNLVEEWHTSLAGMRQRWVARQPLDETLIADLIDDTRREYRQNQLLSLLLDDRGRNRIEVGTFDQAGYGVTRLHDRGAFIPDWPTGYSGFAERVGAAFARAEDGEVGRRIVESEPDLRVVSWNDFDEAVAQALAALEERGCDDLVVLISDAQLRELLTIVPPDDGDPDSQYLLGEKSGYYVLSCPQIPDAVAVVMDLSVTGRLDYRVPGDGDSPLRSSIEPVDRERAQELLEQNPDLAVRDGRRLPDEDAVAWLQTQVLWKSELHVRYRVEETEGALLVRVDEPPEGEEFRNWLLRRRTEG